MASSYLRDVECSQRLPPRDTQVVIALADRVGGNRHSLMAMALRERELVELQTRSADEVHTAAMLALVWHEMTPEQLRKFADLALSFMK